MKYVSWALHAEGPTDRAYLGVVVPRLINHLISSIGATDAVVPDTPAVTFGIRDRSFDNVAKSICEAKDAFYVIFVHGDLGGRGVAKNIENRTCSLRKSINDICDIDLNRCVVSVPKKEIESWTLADPGAVRAAFGLSSGHQLIDIPDIPRHVEEIANPKTVCEANLRSIYGGRKRPLPRWPYENIAQEQNISRLLAVPSFLNLAEGTKRALRTLGYVGL